MAHPKIKNTNTFTDIYNQVLDLSRAQIESIDDLDYILLRDYMFDRDPNYCESTRKFQYTRSLLKILTEQQRKRLKEIRRSDRLKYENQGKIRLENSISFLKKKYQSLNLQNSEIYDLKNILNEIQEKMRKNSILQGKRIPLYGKQHRDIARQLLDNFLSEEQLEQFISVVRKDEEDQRNWLITLNKSKYPYPGLTNRQIEEIQRMEESIPKKDMNGDYYSEWEQLELEKQLLHDILDEKQFKLYLVDYSKKRKTIINDLKVMDQRKQIELNRASARQQFIMSHILPIRSRHRNSIAKRIPKAIRDNLVKWRDQSLHQVAAQFERSKQQADRYTRGFTPNEIATRKMELLSSVLIATPPYSTILIDEILVALPLKTQEILANKPKEIISLNQRLQDFDIANYEKNGGTYDGGIMVYRGTKEEYRKNEIISNLLLFSSIEENIHQMNQLQEMLKVNSQTST